MTATPKKSGGEPVGVRGRASWETLCLHWAVLPVRWGQGREKIDWEGRKAKIMGQWKWLYILIEVYNQKSKTYEFYCS